MSDGGSGQRRSLDTLVVPFIFVPDGEPVPHEWLARCSDPIRAPARYMPHQPPARDAGKDRPVSSNAEPDPNAADQEDAIATYVRVNAFLDQIGSGHSGLAGQPRPLEPTQDAPIPSADYEDPPVLDADDARPM